EGRWVLEAWAPWLDPQFPFPAKPGELRWYTTLGGKSQWLQDGQPFSHDGEHIRPRSRTFIPAKLSDNPILAATGYEATLQAMPEPLRSILLYGDFRTVMEDDPWQVVPMAWVEAAQARWTAGPPPGTSLDAIGVDVARGGPAQTVIAKRYGTWFAPLIKVSGRQTTDGPSVAALVYQEYVPGCAINIDIGATAGGGAYESLRFYRDIVDPINPINNAQTVAMRDRSGKYRLINVRAAAYWKLRECLDPVHGESLALPPDSGSGVPVAPPYQGRRTTSTAPPAPGNCGQNPQDSELCDCRSCVGRCRATLPVGTLQSAPAPPLLVPVEGCCNMQYLPQHRCSATTGRSLEEQQLFLQVGGEVDKGDDLTHARPADVAQPSRRGVTAQHSRANQVVDMPGQGHELCDARDAGRACLCRFRCRRRVVLLRASAATERHGASDDGGSIHALSFREEERALTVMATSAVVPS